MKQNRSKKQSQDLLKRIAELIMQMQQVKKQNSDITEVNEQTSTKICENTMIKRMEENYKKTKLMIEQKRKQKILQQDREIKNFKVYNQKSIQINKSRNEKPIYERTTEIMRSKQNKIQSKQILEEINKINNVKNSLRSSKYDFNQFYQQLTERQIKKNQMLNIKRTQNINLKYQQCKMKPQLGSNTIEILKKSPFYQKQLLQRFSVYEKKKQIKRLSKLKQIKQLQTPFTPKISQNSQILASKSSQKLNTPYVFDRISRSPSHDCVSQRLSKHQNNQQEQQFKNSRLSLTPRNMNVLKSKQNINKKSMVKLKNFDRALTSRNEISNTEISTSDRKDLTRRQYKHNGEQNNYDAKKLLQNNRNQLISFVKKLIISQRKQKK